MMQLLANEQKDVWGRGPELVPFASMFLPIACPISLVTSGSRTCDLQVIQHLLAPWACILIVSYDYNLSLTA